LKSAYNIKSQDKREPQRVKSLQLLCFKLANHKKKIMLMLEKYVTQQGAQEEDDRIPFEAMNALMTDFTLITGIVFMQYDQFMKGEVLRKNDPKALKLFLDHIKSKLIDQNGDGHLVRDSV